MSENLMSSAIDLTSKFFTRVCTPIFQTLVLRYRDHPYVGARAGRGGGYCYIPHSPYAITRWQVLGKYTRDTGLLVPFPSVHIRRSSQSHDRLVRPVNVKPQARLAPQHSHAHTTKQTHATRANVATEYVQQIGRVTLMSVDRKTFPPLPSQCPPPCPMPRAGSGYST